MGVHTGKNRCECWHLCEKLGTLYLLLGGPGAPGEESNMTSPERDETQDYCLVLIHSSFSIQPGIGSRISSGYSYASAFNVWLTVAKLDTARCLSIAHEYISCKEILAYHYSLTHVQYTWSLNAHWVGKSQIQMDNVVFHLFAVLCYLVRNGTEQGTPGTWGYKMGRVLVWDEK